MKTVHEKIKFTVVCVESESIYSQIHLLLLLRAERKKYSLGSKTT